MSKHRPRVVARRVRRARAAARRAVARPPDLLPASGRWLAAAATVVVASALIRTDADQPPPADVPLAASDGTAAVDEPAGPPAVRPVSAAVPAVRTAGSVVLTAGGGPVSADGLPAVALAAYQRAAAVIAAADQGCGLRVELLAAIGKVESNHARGGRVDAAGRALAPILGPALNGAGFAAIADTDGGGLDGDAVWDRAVGPMQFIPSTWASWQADGNGDGRADPQNLYDAALAAGLYLCAGERDLTGEAGLRAAILSYNHSEEYLRTVLAWLDQYSGGLTVRVATEVDAAPVVAATVAGSAGRTTTPPAQPTTQAPAPPPPANPQPATPRPQPTTTTPPSGGLVGEVVGTVADGLGGVVTLTCDADAAVGASLADLSLRAAQDCRVEASPGLTGVLGGLLGGL